MCQFRKAWIGQCKNEGEPFCNEHANLKCSSCGNPATRECDSTMGLVCGCPLCDDCEHELAEDGTNGYQSKHCRKDAQKYTPWYMRPFRA